MIPLEINLKEGYPVNEQKCRKCLRPQRSHGMLLICHVPTCGGFMTAPVEV